jgi:hypothetical protein
MFAIIGKIAALQLDPRPLLGASYLCKIGDLGQVIRRKHFVATPYNPNFAA